jgi:hypothetical protein
MTRWLPNGLPKWSASRVFRDPVSFANRSIDSSDSISPRVQKPWTRLECDWRNWLTGNGWRGTCQKAGEQPVELTALARQAETTLPNAVRLFCTGSWYILQRRADQIHGPGNVCRILNPKADPFRGAEAMMGNCSSRRDQGGRTCPVEYDIQQSISMEVPEFNAFADKTNPTVLVDTSVDPAERFDLGFESFHGFEAPAI